MPKFSVAFVAPTDTTPLRHRIIEAADQEGALRTFFNDEASSFYSNDDQGFHYFKEDFSDALTLSGSIIALG